MQWLMNGVWKYLRMLSERIPGETEEIITGAERHWESSWRTKNVVYNKITGRTEDASQPRDFILPSPTSRFHFHWNFNTVWHFVWKAVLAECGGRSSYSSCSSSGPTQDRCSVSRYILTSTLHSLLLPSPEISVRPWQTSFDLCQSILSLAMLMCWNWTLCDLLC